MTTLELLQVYRELNQANARLVQELVGLVIHGAQIQVESVDSHVIVEILTKHNKVIKKINERVIGE